MSRLQNFVKSIKTGTGQLLARIKPALVEFRSTLQGALQALRTRLLRWQRAGVPANDFGHEFKARDYPGSRDRQYVVHVPAGRRSRRPRPLVMVLHGCRQTNRDIEQISGFNELADKHGFIVVYPFVTSYRGMRIRNCWGWWFEREIHGGAGEVEDLWHIIEETCANYPINPRRIHVAGLSSGAGMSVAMMVAHASRIAAGAAVAGVPYGEKAEAVRNAFNQNPRHRSVANLVDEMKQELSGINRIVPLQIIHSRNDRTVDFQSAINLRDSWGQCFDFSTQTPLFVNSGQVGNTRWHHGRYLDGRNKPVLETIFLEGPGHGWYGGQPGDFSYPEAPNVSEMIWGFFKSHPLPR